jgi:hypothetical protein
VRGNFCRSLAEAIRDLFVEHQVLELRTTLSEARDKIENADNGGCEAVTNQASFQRANVPVRARVAL